MVRALAAHVALGEPVELSVNEWREFFEGFLLAVAPRCKKLSKLVRPRPVHGPRNLSHCAHYSRLFRNGFGDTSHHRQHAEMVSIVICDQKRFAQASLAVAVRDLC